MTSYEIRLDDLGLRNSSYSTAIIAADVHRSIHWGHASYRGSSSPIVTVKIGFLSATVDETVIGKKKLEALRSAFYFIGNAPTKLSDVVRLAEMPATTPVDMPTVKPGSWFSNDQNRRDAATAAILAEHYDLAMSIDPTALFDQVVCTAVNYLAGKLTVEHLAGMLKAGCDVTDDLRRQGACDAKAELRAWLEGSQ